MSIRIVVADGASALLYDITHRSELASALHVSEQLSDPAARLHERDLVTDRPGRKADGGPLRSGRRGAAARHATNSEHSVHSHEVESFAHQIAKSLSSAINSGTVDQLVLVSAPHFLGLLRAALPASVGARVLLEIEKDLVRQPESSLRQHLRAEIDAGRLHLHSLRSAP